MRFTSVFCAGVSLLSLAAPAIAQTGQVIDETPPAGTQLPTSEPEGVDRMDDTGQLDPSNEIIVSARRREESVQDVPQTVNVVTAAQVEKLNLRNFTDIAAVVPGLQLQAVSSFSNTATVRGIAFSPESSGNNPSVEFYLNDAPISSGFLFQSTFDFGQFELQRGPQGTLRGRAAPSGSIAVTTRRPDLDEVGLVMNGTLTDLDARKVDGAFNIPIIRDVLGVRIAGVIDNNELNRVRTIKEETDPTHNEGPFSRVKAIRASVRFEPADWVALNVMGQHLNNKTHRLGQVASNSLFVSGAPQTTRLIEANDRLSNEDVGSYETQRQKVYVGNADFRFAGQRLSYVGSYNEQKFGNLGQQDPGDYFTPPNIVLAERAFGDPAGFAPVCVEGGRRSGFTPTNGVYYQCSANFAKRKSHELRLASEERIAGIFDYVVGGFHDSVTNKSNLTTETPIIGLPTIQRTAIFRRGKSTEKSAFGNITAHLLDDRFEISGGLRYIDFESDDLPTLSGPANAQQIATGRTRPCPDFEQQTCFALGGGGTTNDNATVYLASVKFKPTDDIMVYALTGSSWRPGPRVVGAFSASPSARELSFLNLPPERSKSYEVGAKTSFMNGRGRFNVSGFYQKFKDYPFRGAPVFYLSTSATTGGLEVANFNFVSPVPVTVKGIEGELSYDILDRWTFGINAAYADGKIKNGTVACNDLNGDGVPDINPATPTVPQLQAALGAGQTISQCSGQTRRSAQSPKFSANIQSEYGFDLGANTDGFVRGLYSFFGKTSNDPANGLDDVGAYGLLNLYTGIRDKDGAWEITLFGKNITKEREVLSVSSTELSTPVRTFTGRAVTNSTFVSQYRGITMTAPREFGLTARVALGSR